MAHGLPTQRTYRRRLEISHSRTSYSISHHQSPSCLRRSRIQNQTLQSRRGTMTPQQTIAHTLWGEARGETDQGIQAVTSVIYNRTRHYLASHQSERPEEAMQAVCLSPHQFSCWSNNQFNQEGPEDCQDDQISREKWTTCDNLATQLISGQFTPTIPAINYHATYCHPSWADSMTFICQIGKHLFYK